MIDIISQLAELVETRAYIADNWILKYLCYQLLMGRIRKWGAPICLGDILVIDVKRAFYHLSRILVTPIQAKTTTQQGNNAFLEKGYTLLSESMLVAPLHRSQEVINIIRLERFYL